MNQRAWSKPHAHKNVLSFLRGCELVSRETAASVTTIADRLATSRNSIADIVRTMNAEHSGIFLINMMKALAASRHYVVSGQERFKGVLVHIDGSFSVRVRKDDICDPTPNEIRGPVWMYDQWTTKKLTLDLARAIDVESRLVPNNPGPHPMFQPGVPLIARYVIAKHDLEEKEKRDAGQPNA
jgi:hypothetical protein